MTVGRVARPVAVRCQQLDAHQPHRVLPHLGAHEVRDLPCRRAGATDLDRHVFRRAVPRGQPPVTARHRQRHLTARRRNDRHRRVARHVGEVGHPGEHRHSTGEHELVAVAAHGDVGRRDRQDAGLRVAGRDGALYSWGQRKHSQSGERPPRVVRGEGDRIGAVGERTVWAMQGHDELPGRTIRAARSMARSTSPSAGYNNARPTTSPRTFGTSIAASHDA